MPTYSLLEARTLANTALDAGAIAEITQASQHRFELNPSVIKTTKPNLRMIIPSVVSAIALVLVGLTLIATADSNPTQPPSSTAEAENLWLDNLEPEQLNQLVETGTLAVSANVFSEVKRIELGGFLTLLVNQTIGDETRIVRLDLIHSDQGWQIEKWVRLE